MEDLKKELVSLSATDQAEVAAFLFHVRHSADDQYQAAIQRRMDDKDASHWLTTDEFEGRSGQN